MHYAAMRGRWKKRFDNGSQQPGLRRHVGVRRRFRRRAAMEQTELAGPAPDKFGPAAVMLLTIGAFGRGARRFAAISGPGGSLQMMAKAILALAVILAGAVAALWSVGRPMSGTPGRELTASLALIVPAQLIGANPLR
jgi:hypothetical protein